MNLGDGLKLETQILGGKPKLILASYGVQKNSKQVGHSTRIQKSTQRIKPTGQILKSVQSNNVKTEQPRREARLETGHVLTAKPPANVLKELENKHHPTDQNVQQVKQDLVKTKPAPKQTLVSQISKQRPQLKKTITAEELRESLVCLTKEQFQQILQTINQGNKDISQEPLRDEETVDENNEDLVKTEDENTSSLHEHTKEKTTDVQIVRQPADLFSTLGEQERDRSLQEKKKEQWRKELDEQIALKKQRRADKPDWPGTRQHINAANEKPRTSDQPKATDPSVAGTPLQNNPIPATSTGTDTSNSTPYDLNGPSGRASSSFSSPDLPAAIRSAFIVGEAAPMDHPFSATKRQQQKKWLDELNKQRMEDVQRKMKEKQRFLETEEHDLWAMHFDSFKKPIDHRPITRIPPSANFLLSPEIADSSPVELSPSPVPSYLYHAESGMQKSVDEDNAQDHKTGYLRTMTALLDPVQIEERERKRLKQIEHQKAITAQVEEKRRQKQLEEQQRQREEREEEQRLQKERDKMQRQFEEDSLRQKQKEEVLKMKTNDLYQSMLRAQEEAQRLKQEQRMRDLRQKGHDVSKLQKHLAGDVQSDLSRAVSRVTDLPSEDQGNAVNSTAKQSFSTTISPRRDTGVQTDFGDGEIDTGPLIHIDDTEWRCAQASSPDIPIEFKVQTKTDIHLKKQKTFREKGDSRKENKNTVNDIYEPFARTDKVVKDRSRKPDWNRNNPNKKYIPASERYPKGLQKHREESKARRQTELLNLVEKNTVTNVKMRQGNSPVKTSPMPVEDAKVFLPPQETKVNQMVKREEPYQKTNSNFRRPDSPPVPAVKNRLHQAQKKLTAPSNQQIYSGTSVHRAIDNAKHSNTSPESSDQESDRPPSSHFIPYVRTKEIYYLDPNAPMSRPSTHDPQYRRPGDEQEMRQIFSSDHARDPLLNPNVVKNKDRQQAILRGLSELRKGLLQKQKELETVLMPDV
ncbi:Hypothetical predicted protein [Pelobates cultripes]|uniref:CCDC66 domain-containing protein n=1 Tax=Pelobates cultripes TaxID=61616 RepID=A0AAD1WJ05_PELCU|nr:Hypothetical predicted protein [Pelobates cultripes]